MRKLLDASCAELSREYAEGCGSLETDRHPHEVFLSRAQTVVASLNVSN